MRREFHLIIGILVFFVYAYLLHGIQSITIGYFVLGFCAVIIGSILPDILEPATNSKHRGIFHSWGALKCIVCIFGISALTDLVLALPESTKVMVFPVSCCALGYSFHLLADSTTRRGLPT
ncbi:MAG: metal-dependent hydrolase [Methanoregula sp.]|uniref:metal-dependent hydrolase n=1 Tax=Methanoregula sp. TaxID=2052170 RepID=UPI003BB05FDA